MMKGLFRRLSGRKNAEPQLDALLRARQNERSQIGERIDRTCQEMERVVQDGVNLDGNAAQLNRERYRALSDRAKTDQRCFNMLTSAIAQLQTLRDMDSEYRQVEALDRDARACGELEDLERRQDLIELRTEALNRRTEQLAGLQSRRDRLSSSDLDMDDEYARRVAEARAAREKASAASVSVDVPQAASAVHADPLPTEPTVNAYADAAQTANAAAVHPDAPLTAYAADSRPDAQATEPAAPTGFFVPDAPDALAVDSVPCGVCMHIDPAAVLGLQFDETLT